MWKPLSIHPLMTERRRGLGQPPAGVGGWVPSRCTCLVSKIAFSDARPPYSPSLLLSKSHSHQYFSPLKREEEGGCLSRQNRPDLKTRRRRQQDQVPPTDRSHHNTHSPRREDLFRGVRARRRHPPPGSPTKKVVVLNNTGFEFWFFWGLCCSWSLLSGSGGV